MKLYLKNIGKIAEASVEISGITVIAGENDTGKSTVGKALFAVFNSFYQIQEQIAAERIESIENWLNHICMVDDPSQKGVFLMPDRKKIAKNLLSLIESSDTRKKETLRQEAFELLQQSYQESGIQIERKSTNEIISHIEAVFDVSDEEFLKTILDKNLSEEFQGQVCNIFAEDTGEIELKIKQQTISVLLEESEITKVQPQTPFSLRTEVIYLDDPFVLDKQIILWEVLKGSHFGHQEHLQKKLFSIKKEGNLVDEILVRNKLERIYEKISFVCNGELTYHRYEGAGYKKKNSTQVLNMKNLSTGLKTFVILKTLLKNGTIEQNGTIILDEPEIHLHPEWQLLFAELIVLLQKEFGIHVLLNTHSPYFLRAIQVYSAKYEIADRCHYYLSEAAGEQAIVTDVTNDIDKIYAKLSYPLQKLEDERWENA